LAATGSVRPVPDGPKPAPGTNPMLAISLDPNPVVCASKQGLHFVDFLALLERFLSDRGCI